MNTQIANRKSQIANRKSSIVYIVLLAALVAMTGCKEDLPVTPPPEKTPPLSVMKDADTQVSAEFIAQFRNAVQRGHAEMPTKIDEFIRRTQAMRTDYVRPTTRPNVKFIPDAGAQLSSSKLMSRMRHENSQDMGVMSGNSTYQEQSQTVTVPQQWQYFLLGTLYGYTVPTLDVNTNQWRNDVRIEAASQSFLFPSIVPVDIDLIAVRVDAWVDGFLVGGTEQVLRNASFAYTGGVIQDNPIYLNVYSAQSTHGFTIEGVYRDLIQFGAFLN